jgi:aspartate/methionine/tyrosine aminotransferase
MIIPSANRLNGVSEYYFASKLREVKQLQHSGKPVLNLGVGSPDLAPSEKVIRVFNDTLRLDGSHAYQPYNGIPVLRAAFADWYRRVFGITFDPEKEILPLMGSKEGIMHITMAFTNPGDRVLVPDPGYLAYESVAKLLDLEVVKYDLKQTNNWQPDPEQLEEYCQKDCKMIWLNYPHMPTGANADKALFQRLYAFARARKILLINDNPYALVNNDKPSSILQVTGINEHILELNSLSKSHNMPGYRVGCVVGSSSNIDRILKVKSNFDSGMFLPVQLAAAEALSTGLHWHEAQNKIYKSRAKIIHQFCDIMGCAYDPDSVGLFIWTKIPEGFEDGKAFADHLLYEHDIFVAPGSIFGENGKDYVRISLCQMESALKKMIERVQKNKKL